MTTNQTIDGVPRSTIEAILRDGGSNPEVHAAYRNARVELRALLDAPSCPKCNDTGEADSGGVQPWGEGINIPCDCKPAAQPQGEPVAWTEVDALDFMSVALRHAEYSGLSPSDILDGLRYMAEKGKPAFFSAERPAPVAVVLPLEVVGRQCFPSEAMKSVQGYRKEPWVDGDVGKVPSEPGFYRIEPLVRLSDVVAPVEVVLPERYPPGVYRGNYGEKLAEGWNACIDEMERLNPGAKP